MAEVVPLPKLGNSVESCIFVNWSKQLGEEVAVGETLCEVETDKTVVEVASPLAGTLLHFFCQPGEEVSVFRPLVVVGQPGEEITSFIKEGSVAEPDKPAAPSLTGMSTMASEPLPTRHAEKLAFSPRARKYAKDRGLSSSWLAVQLPEGGSGPGRRILERDVSGLLGGRATSVAAGKMNATTAQAQAVGQGTGLGGRILVEDLARQPPADSVSSSAPQERRRRVIAERMQRSLQQHAQLSLHRSIEVGALLAYRAQLKGSEDEEWRGITLNDLLLFACVRALKLCPLLNAHWREGRAVVLPQVDLGFALDCPEGLLVPVIEGAERLSLRQLAQRAHHLAQEGRGGRAVPSGGSFTVSNLGALGVEHFTPILNSPEVAILGVGAVGKQPVPADDGCAWESRMACSLTIDHQAVDGAQGARFLEQFAQVVAQFTLHLAG